MTSTLVPPRNTFVLRFWWSDTVDDTRSTNRHVWRVRVEHLQSGEVMNLQDVHTLLAFIERFTGPLFSAAGEMTASSAQNREEQARNDANQQEAEKHRGFS